MNETYYVKTEEKEHTVKIQNEEEKFYSYDGELVEDPTGTLVEKTITENGEYLPSDDDADGYSKVTVNTPIKTLIEKSITANGEYLPASDNADGYSKVTVDVPSQVNKVASVVDGSVTEITADDLAGATMIRGRAFYYCRYLVRITIPNSVTRMEKYAFNYCFALQSVTMEATTPPTLEPLDGFDYMKNATIYVPAESVDAYKSATNWVTIAHHIQAIPE